MKKLTLEGYGLKFYDVIEAVTLDVLNLLREDFDIDIDIISYLGKPSINIGIYFNESKFSFEERLKMEEKVLSKLEKEGFFEFIKEEEYFLKMLMQKHFVHKIEYNQINFNAHLYIPEVKGD